MTTAQPTQQLTTKDYFKIILVLLVAGFFGYRSYLPFSAEYAFREAYNLAAGGKREAAIEKYEKAVSRAPWETHYHIQLGRLYEEQAGSITDNREEKLKYIQKAEAIYRECLRLSPENPWYVNRLGEVYGLYASIAETPQEQAEFLQKRESQIIAAAELDKNNALFQMSVAYLYHQRGELEEALVRYEHVLTIDDTFGEAYFNMADIYRRRGETARQKELYQTIIEKAPNFKNARLQLGRLYEAEGALDAAIEQYIQELNLDRNNELVYQLLGSAFQRKGDWENMSRAYARLKNMRPETVQYYLFYAQAEANLGRLQNALAALEEAGRVDPGNPQIAQNIRNLRAVLNPQPVAPPVPVVAEAEEDSVESAPQSISSPDAAADE